MLSRCHVRLVERAFPKCGSWASPLASRLATASGRIKFVSCGLVIRLRLLSTRPRGHAVTFDYEPEHRSEELFMSDGSPREGENRLEKLGYTISLDKRDAA